MIRLLLLLLTFFVGLSFSGQDPLSDSIKRGEEIYNDFCVQCHKPNGAGIKGFFPPLANSDYLLNNREESIDAVKNGQKGEITVNGVKYNGTMAPLGLDDQEVADVMNYILNSWGNKSENIITADEVNKI